MNIHIRHFRDTDQQQVRRFILAGLAERWGTIDQTVNPDIDDIAGSYSSENFLVAFREGVLVGTGGLIRESESVVRIVRVWVARDLRRTGIGTLILNRLLDGARERNYARVVWETTSAWDDAVCFYKKHGFVIEDYRDNDTHFCKDLAD